MIRRVLPGVCLLVLVSLAEARAQGWRGGPGGPGAPSRSSPTMLLGQESVQKELQLSPAQVQSLTAISEQQRTAMSQTFQLDRSERGARMQEISKQTDALVAQVISPQQQQRLAQISLQQQGARAFDRPDVVQGLGLSPEQLAQIKQVQESANEEMSELFRKQMDEIRKAAEKKAAAVLTPQQAAKWSEARGTTFEGEIVYSRNGSSRSISPGEQAKGEANSPSTDPSKTPTDDKYKAAGRPPSAQKPATTNPAAKKSVPAKFPPQAPAKKSPPAAKKPSTDPAPNP